MNKMDLTQRLENCYSGAVFDVMRELGLKDGLLPRHLKSLDPEVTVCGPVSTVLGRTDNSLTEDESLLRWTELLGKAPAGHVVVCQPQDDDRALMGELSAETLQFRGVRGYVVDGGCRDVSFIRKMKFPVFCRFTTPLPGHQRNTKFPSRSEKSRSNPGTTFLGIRTGWLSFQGFMQNPLSNVLRK